MKVLHIIPSAFDYFDDIRQEAFRMLQSEREYGVDAEAITLEYTPTTKKTKKEIELVAPKREYLGQDSLENNSNIWTDFDVINLHCPFLGGAGKILNWSKENSEKLIVLTYHHDFQTTDFFSWFIKIYNYFYLPRLFKQARLAAFFFDRYENSKIGLKLFKNEEKVAVLGMPDDGQDVHSDLIVEDLIMVYNSIAKTKV